MSRRLACLAPMLLAAGSALAQTAPMTGSPTPPAAARTDDPFAWLEDKDGARALAWVEAENAKTLPRLERDPHYAGFYRDALAIASAADRIPMPSQLNGRIVNFWRDAAHPQGIWRVTSEASYATAAPQWTTLIDLDSLSRAEGKKWVWKGATCLAPEERRCLVALSEGGEDAVSYREFDLVDGRFVDGGFVLPKSKQEVAWVDRDTLLVSRDWGAGTMTRSSYPFVVKLVKRGAPLDAATEVARGEVGDQLYTSAETHVDGAGNRLVLIERRPTFFGSETWIWTPQGTKRLVMPPRVRVSGLVDGRVIFTTSEPWGQIAAGAVAWAPLAEVVAGAATPRLLFAPTPRQAVQQVAVTRDRVIIGYTDEVRARATVFAAGASGWTGQAVPLPDNASFDIVSTDTRGNRAFVAIHGFVSPTALATLDAAAPAAPVPLKQLPARFDADGVRVEQHHAVSSDGTRIPYFVVLPKGARLDGTTPTIMTAYGGFELSRLPTYLGATGKLWVERGGAYVLANIRGGGEFGPAWHDAGRKTKRQIIYDDFAAVARDLVARRITDARHLGIYGGSNGGLLMGVSFNQHPELWRAVSIAVPLLDMLNYERIAAGESWVDEYGSASVPEERAFLARISPYHNVRAGVDYPEPYIWTTTKDDRVGPQHARKFAARLADMRLPYLFYEDTEGGHSGDADIAQGARLLALQTTYFAQKLMPAVE